MYHKISSMCDKIRVIYDKSEQLRIAKYGHQDDETSGVSSQIEIDTMIKDIQQIIGRAHVRTPVTRGSRMPSSA